MRALQVADIQIEEFRSGHANDRQAVIKRQHLEQVPVGQRSGWQLVADAAAVLKREVDPFLADSRRAGADQIGQQDPQRRLGVPMKNR